MTTDRRGRSRGSFGRRQGLRLPRHRATSAHVCALYPVRAEKSSALKSRGLLG